MPCTHLHLRYEDGSYVLRCIDCGQGWTAVDAKGAPDYTLKSVPIYPPNDTRHDRWVLPQTEPVKKKEHTCTRPGWCGVHRMWNEPDGPLCFCSKQCRSKYERAKRTKK